MFAFPTHTVPIIIVPNTATTLEIKYIKEAALFLTLKFYLTSGTQNLSAQEEFHCGSVSPFDGPVSHGIVLHETVRRSRIKMAPRQNFISLYINIQISTFALKTK